MPQGGRVQHYSKEFKQTAIELALSSDVSIKEVAQDLQMSEKTLYNWISTYKKAHEPSTQEPSNDLEAQIKRLKKENAQLKQERDILKKATVYFAKEAH